MFLLFVVFFGCELFTPKIHIVVRNGTSADIDEVAVSFGDHDITAGIIPPGAHKSYGPIVTDIPPDASVSWQTLDGREHTQRVSVRSQIRENRSGDVVFTIVAADRIDVSFKAR